MRRGVFLAAILLVKLVFLNSVVEAKYDGRGFKETDYQQAWQDLQEAKIKLTEKYRAVLDLLSKENQKKIKKEQVRWERGIGTTCLHKTAQVVRRLERQMEINRCEAQERLARIKVLDQFLETAQGETTSRRIADAPSYAKIFPAVTQKPRTPILLPGQHAIDRVLDRSVSIVLESSSQDHYSLKFEREPGCQKTKCLAGAFHVYKSTPPASILGPQYASTDTYNLTLAKGVAATLEKELVGEGIRKEYRWLRWTQGDTHYALTVKNATESELKTLADSAIRTGSWR